MTHKYKIGDWVRVVSNSNWHGHSIGDVRTVFQHPYMGCYTLGGNHSWVRENDITPAVMTLAEWDALLPVGVMVGDVFEAQEARHHAWTEGCHYIAQTNGMVYDDTNNTIPNAERKIQPFTLISRASNAPLALKHMTPEQAGPIMEAFRQGGALEWFDGMFWVVWFAGKPLDRDAAYRFPPKLATMNWTGIHPDINHVAMDEDGMVWLFGGEPHIEGDSWGAFTYMRRIGHILSPCPFQTNGARWKDTRIARPKEDGE